MRLVLLDRDGVLNEEVPNYVKHPGELRLLAGSARAVARLNRAGTKVAVCTNQSAVGRGIIDEAMLERVHQQLREELAREGAHLDAIFACTDHPDRATRRRKPGPGMLEEALSRFKATPSETPMIGDHRRDLEAALAAGCQRHLVRTGHGAKAQAEGIPPALLPVRVHDDLAAAVAALLGPESV
ncbi:MAG: HAD-IIIA family hydrolase [Alphaproteobacteria bacterium]|nr:HAD-IIIA family hydrolase [Alphaproteobacteria bacterium]